MTSLSDPTVSVVVITYNHAPYINEAIESIVSQDYSGNWEIIVADDCSTDGTDRILESLAAQHPKLTVLTTPRNVGAQRNLRRSLEHARGTYVAFLEGDDYWTEPSKLSRQSAYLDQNSHCVGVAHLTRIVASGIGDGETFGDLVGCDVLTHTNVLGGTLPHLSSLMYRRTALATIPIWFDSLRGTDWLMCCLLTLHGDMAILQHVMSVYRRNTQSSWFPLAFVDRRGDLLRRRLLLRQHIPSTTLIVNETLARHYALFFSALAKSRDPRKIMSLGATVWKEDRWGAPRQLFMWARTQAADRLRAIARRTSRQRPS